MTKKTSRSLAGGQINASYEGLVERTDTVNISGPVCSALFDVVKNTLEFFPLQVLASRPQRRAGMRLDQLLKSLLTSLFEVYTEKFLTKPLFPVATIIGVANLYGFSSIENFLKEDSDLSQKGKGDMMLAAHMWFAWFLDCEIDAVV